MPDKRRAASMNPVWRYWPAILVLFLGICAAVIGVVICHSVKCASRDCSQAFLADATQLAEWSQETSGVSASIETTGSGTTIADLHSAPERELTIVPEESAASKATQIPGSFHGPVFADVTQVIVVTADSMRSTRATLTVYQESDGTWLTVMSTGACVGKKGLVLDSERIEGGLQTPIGIYSLPYAFGIAANPAPAVSSLPYQRVGKNTYYDGNYGSPTFNVLVEGMPSAGDNYEYMYQPTAYKYGIDIGFNLEQKPGKGNAIFIHCNTGSGYTAGCVSISESKMVELLKWLDRTQNPVVLICLTSELDSFYY